MKTMFSTNCAMNGASSYGRISCSHAASIPPRGLGSKTSGSKPKTTSAVCAITPRSPYGAAITSATKRGSVGDGTPGTPNRDIPNGTRIIGDQLRRQYYEVLPEAVAACSPGTPYHPSSPWSRHEGTSENSEGDTHFWKVWHSRAPIADYNATRSRFFSEYGFQSFPEYASVLRFAPEERDWDIESEVMMAHQRGGDFANMRIRQYLEDEYWPARDFRTFPLHEPRFAGRRHQDRHRGAPVRQTLLLGRSSGSTTTAGPWLRGPAATGTAAGRHNIISPARPSTTSSYRPLPRETR